MFFPISFFLLPGSFETNKEKPRSIFALFIRKCNNKQVKKNVVGYSLRFAVVAVHLMTTTKKNATYFQRQQDLLVDVHHCVSVSFATTRQLKKMARYKAKRNWRLTQAIAQQQYTPCIPVGHDSPVPTGISRKSWLWLLLGFVFSCLFPAF